MKKLILIFIMFLLIFPVAIAQENLSSKETFTKEEDSSLVSKIVYSLIDSFVYVIIKLVNVPIEPLVSLLKILLSANINIDFFGSLWAVIIYTLSLFYSLLFLYCGFNFMISGYNAAKRENAKEWFKNIIIMIILVQSSFFFYRILVELSSILTKSILNMIPENFFLITFNSLFDLILSVVYLAAILIAVLLLTIRYLIVSFGVVFFPIGIFLYFIPFTKEYGKAIINFLVTCVFISFFNAVILAGCSKLISIPLFEHYKIIVMISSFLLISFASFYFMLFNLIISGVKFVTHITNPISSAIKKVL